MFILTFLSFGTPHYHKALKLRIRQLVDGHSMLAETDIQYIDICIMHAVLALVTVTMREIRNAFAMIDMNLQFVCRYPVFIQSLCHRIIMRAEPSRILHERDSVYLFRPNLCKHCKCIDKNIRIIYRETLAYM